MRKTTTTVLAAIMLALASPAFCNWEIQLGQDDGRAGLAAPISEEDSPDGPASFRVLNGNLWILDSVKGRAICLDAENKLSRTVKFPSLKAEYILTDFALQTSAAGELIAIAAIDMRAKEIVVVDIEGKEIRRIKAEKMMQLDEIDIDSQGQVYVGDYAAASISVFGADGKLLRSMPWQVSGFVTDRQNNLHMLDYKEGSGHALVTFAADGKEIARHEIGMPDMQNPRIWSIASNGEKLVSFVPPSGDSSMQVLYRFAADGKVLSKADFKNPYYVNRFMAAGDSGAWLVKADYLKAEVPVRIEAITLK